MCRSLAESAVVETSLFAVWWTSILCALATGHVILLNSYVIRNKMAVVRWSPVQDRAQDFAVFGKDLKVYRYEIKVSSSVLTYTACT